MPSCHSVLTVALCTVFSAILAAFLPMSLFTTPLTTPLMDPLAYGAQVEGVVLNDTEVLSGQTLKLVGAGRRRRFFFDVYVMGAYSASGICRAEDLATKDEAKLLQLEMLRDIPQKKMVEALKEALEQATPPSASDALKKHVADFLATFTADFPKGYRVGFFYQPGAGTVKVQGGKVQGAPIPGKDFADVIFGAYFNAKSCCEDLKEMILKSCRKG